jgi:serine/threonine protein kinase
VRAGQRVGKYVLDERIAVGGMAEVWAGRVEGPQGFSKPVALKFILESFAGDPELERLFVNEARIAAQLQHANLVTVFDFDKVGTGQEPGLAGRYYIAMERVEGQDLRRLAEAAKRAGYLFPIGVALHLAGEALKALRYVHERRDHGRSLDLVHRDVSPHNVLVGYSGEVKLSDFGIAKTRAHSARTKTGTVRGKLSYASPEQLGGLPVDHRTDQFALGVTLWEILAGRRLFDGRDDLETIGQVVRCAVPPLGVETSAGHAAPPAVEAVVRRMLSPRREDRFPTTGDALSAVLGLPSYLADGTALGDLMRTLFRPAHVEMPVTMPIQALGPAAREAATRTMEKATARKAQAAPPAADGTPATARAAPEPASQLATRPQVPARRRARVVVPPLASRARRRPRALVVAGGVAIAAALVVAVWLVAPTRSTSREVVAGPDPAPASAAVPEPGNAAPPAPPAPAAAAPERTAASAPEPTPRAGLAHESQRAPAPATARSIARPVMPAALPPSAAPPAQPTPAQGAAPPAPAESPLPRPAGGAAEPTSSGPAPHLPNKAPILEE